MEIRKIFDGLSEDGWAILLAFGLLFLSSIFVLFKKFFKKNKKDITSNKEIPNQTLYWTKERLREYEIMRSKYSDY